MINTKFTSFEAAKVGKYFYIIMEWTKSQKKYRAKVL